MNKKQLNGIKKQLNKEMLMHNLILVVAIVVPNTAGEQIVFDTWDLASIDRA